MIDILNIIKALTLKVRAIYPNIEFNNKDITEGFNRPCFYLESDISSAGYMTETYLDEEHQLTLYYFAERREKGTIELLKIKTALTRLLLKPLEVESGFFVHLDNIEADINNEDKSLIINFSVQTVQEELEEDGDLIEELEYKQRG